MIRMKKVLSRAGIALSVVLAAACDGTPRESADRVYLNGKVLTVDSAFTVAGAFAVKGGRFLAVGADREVLRFAGPRTERIDLDGATVVPGLIEAHAHPERAALSELTDSIPDVGTIDQLLNWIRVEAAAKPDGEWIVHPKFFATRLIEMRAPTLAELDSVAPRNPVFLNGSYGGSINTAAMTASGISRSTQHDGLLRDEKTGRLNGLLRFTALGLLKLPPDEQYSIEERARALAHLNSLYNRVGFTGVTTGGLGSPDDLDLQRRMLTNGTLTARYFGNVYARWQLSRLSLDEVRSLVESLGPPSGSGDEWVRVGALKTVLDGGILTGTAYLREPWGSKANLLFGIQDPDYRGILRMGAEDLEKLVRAGAERGWKLTAHCTGGGAVDVLLDAFEAVAKDIDIRPLRFSIIHGNFYDRNAIERCARFQVIADAQPAWFYKDGDAMLEILGPERIKTFHPNRSLLDAGVVISFGSDHMVKLDDRHSINPFNPWVAIWSAVTRKTERGTLIAPEEAITRAEALRCYTINNAFASFEEDIKGSIEPGKLADFAVLDRDYLAVPEDELKDIQVTMTVLGGKVVYEK